MKNLIKFQGIVLECLPNVQFIVELEDKNIIRCYISGKMNINHIKVIIGDRVIVELNPSMEIKNQIGRIVLRK